MASRTFHEQPAPLSFVYLPDQLAHEYRRLKLTNHGSQAARILRQSLKSKAADGKETIRAWDQIDERLSAGEKIEINVPDPRVGRGVEVRILVVSETPRLRVLGFLRGKSPDSLYQRISGILGVA